ncbi:MAG TPA: hypothetical protein VFW83_10580 [Bryobacteraceae bacterium]|nr:hypothetical protein [Bryobacteraceae bacterium]
MRNEVFAGLAGNMDALKRAIDTCEKALAQNPNDAEALVWHGIALLTQSGQTGEPDMQKRAAFFQKGTSEMDRAVQLEPDNLAVRIPRGSALRLAAPRLPESLNRDTLIEEARSDYQRAFDLQKDRLDRLGPHPLGELLQGRGDLQVNSIDYLLKPIEAEPTCPFYFQTAADRWRSAGCEKS